MRLTLSSAELSVLCAALGADAAPFIAGSALAQLERTAMLREVIPNRRFIFLTR